MYYHGGLFVEMLDRFAGLVEDGEDVGYRQWDVLTSQKIRHMTAYKDGNTKSSMFFSVKSFFSSPFHD